MAQERWIMFTFLVLKIWADNNIFIICTFKGEWKKINLDWVNREYDKKGSPLLFIKSIVCNGQLYLKCHTGRPVVLCRLWRGSAWMLNVMYFACYCTQVSPCVKKQFLFLSLSLVLITKVDIFTMSRAKNLFIHWL